MAKDRNTFAKRQREMDRKRKAEEKRLHRAKKKHDVTASPGHAPASGSERISEGTTGSGVALSVGQRTVLTTFQRFRMSPGQMLCFSHSDEDAFRAPLTELAQGGFLVMEKFPGGYSLTSTGFAAMQAMA
jgi:hypothetical protein